MAGNGSSRMLFHRTRDGPIPGVGDYDITKNSISNKNKSPKATIGNAVRFPGKNSLNRFVPNQPAQYVRQADKI